MHRAASLSCPLSGAGLQESPTCPPDRPSKILLVQVGTLFSSPEKERKKTDNPREGWEDGTERKKENRHAKRGMGRGQGPHLHEQDFGRTIRGTGGALLLLTRDTTGSQRGARWTPNSTGGLISV